MGLETKAIPKPTRMKDYAYFELMKVEGVGPKTTQTILGKLASGRDLTAKENTLILPVSADPDMLECLNLMNVTHNGVDPQVNWRMSSREKGAGAVV